MNTAMTNQSGGVNIKPEKLYTQNDIDNLLEQSEDDHRQAREINRENWASKKRKRLNKRKVEKLVKKSNRILVSISSHALPFDFFMTAPISTPCSFFSPAA